MIIAWCLVQDALAITIPPIVSQLNNGTSVTVTVTAEPIITGGFPPFTYEWSDNNANVFVQATTSATTRLQSTGTDVIRTGTLVFICTQANGVAVTASATFNILHGNP
jgi:hypothetical protein